MTKTDAIKTAIAITNRLARSHHNTIREMLIDESNDDIDFMHSIEPESPISEIDFDLARNALPLLIHASNDTPLAYDALTQIAQSLALCPIHLIDDEICADDENDECAHLR